MIDRLKENLSILILGVALLIGYMLPLGEIATTSKFESLRVPRLDLPKELKNITPNQSSSFPEINKPALLGTAESKSNKRKNTQTRLTVRAIMIDGDTKVTNINGRILRIGDQIHRQKILRIEKRGVLIDGPKGKRVLKFR